MTGLKDLFASERGVLTIFLLVSATVLAAMAVLTAQQWLDFAKLVFAAYVVGKTTTSVVGIVKGAPAGASPSDVATPTPGAQ